MLKIVLLSILLVFAICIGVDRYVSHAVRERVYENIAAMPHNKVGLLLGTSKYVGSRINLYYKYRIEAAAELYKAGKVDYILVSGDNGRKGYNEPADMKHDLIALGVPADRIALDYAGFRTLDSIVRCSKIFGQKSITIISQKFHNERSIFLANHKGISAIGYNAQNVPKKWQVKVMVREKMARVKMVLDLLTKKQPKYGGEKLNIEEAAQVPTAQN